MLDFLAEIELRRESDAVDRTVAVLAEVDLVQVGLEDLVLVVVQLEQHRHQELGHLAPHRALGRKEEVLYELLRDLPPCTRSVNTLRARARPRRSPA